MKRKGTMTYRIEILLLVYSNLTIYAVNNVVSGKGILIVNDRMKVDEYVFAIHDSAQQCPVNNIFIYSY